MENLSQRPLTPQEKKQYLLNKYVKRDYKVEDLVPKYAVYFCPNLELIKEWTLVCVCDTLEQAKFEILWKKKFHETSDSELVIDNDPNFKTFKNELLNINSETGQPYEPGEELMKIDYNSSGNMLQVIANSPPPNPSTGFKSMAFYTQFNLDYKGYYKIEEIFEI
jgi:hypothetical protein